MSLRNNFWTNKKVLITGHSGFKGSWMALILEMLGAKIFGISLESKNLNSHLFAALELDKHCNSYNEDINDLEKIKKTFASISPEIVFHLAAQPLVRESYKNPLDTFLTNAVGTANMLEAIRDIDSVESAVFITTDKCYENQEWVWGYREHDAMGGYDPYSASKACAELIINSYRKSFFSSGNSAFIASVRAGNVIGGGDLADDRLIPDIVKAIRDNKKILLRNPYATRPWQHVFEPIRGYLMIAEKLSNREVGIDNSWNFGPLITDVRTVRDMSEMFCNEWGAENIIKHEKEDNPHEAHSLSLDISKAYHQLGWAPKWSLEQSIPLTVDWYKTYLSGKNVKSISNQQIEYYFS